MNNNLIKGQYIKSLRECKNWSQRKLALLCNLTHTEINRIENNEIKEPNIKTLKIIGKILNINYMELYYQYDYIDSNILNNTIVLKETIDNTKQLCDYSSKELLEELLRREIEK
jgi:transcriptional regulator with XRE-family HTH domain